MPTNVEIKARVLHLSRLKKKASELSQDPGQKCYQDDTFFYVPQGRLKLRISSTTKPQLIYYNRADIASPKPSHYVVSSISDPSLVRTVLCRSLGIIGRVQKHRTLYMIGTTRLHLDKIEGLGTYMELEVALNNRQSVENGKQIALDLMNKLGIDLSCLVKGAYLDLLNSSQKRR
jgi:predicted adenylyl cyclase CyaB